MNTHSEIPKNLQDAKNIVDDIVEEAEKLKLVIVKLKINVSDKIRKNNKSNSRKTSQK